MSDVLELRSRTAEQEKFARELLAGLSRTPKTIPCKYFYDAVGSELFEKITHLPEYYQTRTEFALLTRHAAEMAELIGPDIELVEFGAGSLRKVRILLDMLIHPTSYVPIDISGDYLLEVAASLDKDYPDLVLNPVIADFTKPLDLGPLAPGAKARAGFFPGSTIGNFRRDDAVAFLRNARTALAGGGLLIGVDLVKDPSILHSAYNDSEKITAAFNKNLLARANAELDADFDLDAFAHYAPYNPIAQRVEMYLVSLKRQRVRVAGHAISFLDGEAIHTEDSHKYTLETFRTLAAEAGFRIETSWTDAGWYFTIHWLVPA
ncbi:MAG TPA: L-histidine N(alpha)-methyltransferase [Rhizomicrobium sp.]|nr:L-histidine N(alpha)-methyltransferase [Rhizomicrobium sp.]